MQSVQAVHKYMFHCLITLFAVTSWTIHVWNIFRMQINIQIYAFNSDIHCKSVFCFLKSSCIFIILLLRCNLCAEIALIFATHSLYFSYCWFHWSLWYCAIAMLLLVEIIVKKRVHHLHLNCIFTSFWMKTFRSTIFLMMNK